MNALNASAAPAPRRFRHAFSPKRAVLAAGVAIGSVAAFVPAAQATNEFPTNPSLSPLSTCLNEQYHYTFGLYNLNSLGGTTFTVTVSGAIPANAASKLGTNAYFVGPVTVAQPAPQTWIDYIVPEGQTASFDIVDTDSPGVKFHAEPKADCVPDPVGSVTLVCPTNGGSAFVHYEYENTSYATTHYDLSLNGASVLSGDSAWSNKGALTLDEPVAEDSHVAAKITAHGGVVASLDTTADCVPAETTTTTTPDTTPETVPETIPVTVPETTPDTTPETTPQTVPVTSVPATTTPETTPPSSTTPGAPLPIDNDPNPPSVAQLPQPIPQFATVPENVQLPSTGSTSTGTVAAAFALLIGGLGLVRIARRAR